MNNKLINHICKHNSKSKMSKVDYADHTKEYQSFTELEKRLVNMAELLIDVVDESDFSQKQKEEILNMMEDVLKEEV